MSKGTVLKFLVLVSLALVTTGTVRADAGIVPVQGFLASSDGEPIDGAHRLTFTLYDAESDGTSLHTDDWTSVDIDAGYFNVYLGSQNGAALDLAIFRDYPGVWLEVVVDGTEVISPRTQLGSVPAAGYAQYCGDAATVGGQAPASFAPAAHTHSASDLSTVVTSTNVAPIVLSATSSPTYWAFDCGSVVAIPNTAITFTVAVPSVLDLAFAGLVQNKTAAGAVYTRIRVDGTEVGANWGGYRNPPATYIEWGQAANVATATVAAGEHTVDVRVTCDQATQGSIGHGTLKVVAWAQEP